MLIDYVIGGTAVNSGLLVVKVLGVKSYTWIFDCACGRGCSRGDCTRCYGSLCMASVGKNAVLIFKF